MFIGIDVGSGSVRAVLLNRDKTPFVSAASPLKTSSTKDGCFEQSTGDIWTAVCMTVKSLLRENQVPSSAIQGIAFDATCSLVIVSSNDTVTPATPGGMDDVIMWMDHRATAEAADINATRHPALSCVGGKVSVEMQLPKVLWLKRHNPKSFHDAAHFMDLSDWLCFKATGVPARSTCTLACKWLYNAKNGTWPDDLLNAVGLEALTAGDHAKIGATAIPPGTRVGPLTNTAASELGLGKKVSVSTGLIDAHAGLIGGLGCCLGEYEAQDVLFMISGTSACHLALADQPIPVKGVWGPYFSTMFPQKWNAEAGQNCVAPVLDSVVERFGHFLPQGSVDEKHAWLRKRLTDFENKSTTTSLSKLAADLHVWPDYHGNRSPIANEKYTATITGLYHVATSDKEGSIRLLEKVYLAHVQAFALQTRHIVNALVSSNNPGYPAFKAVCMTGGLAKNALFVQAHADALQVPVIVPLANQPVAYGAAILTAFGSGAYCDEGGSLVEFVGKYATPFTVFNPVKGNREYYERKFDVFLKLGKLQAALASQ